MFGGVCDLLLCCPPVLFVVHVLLDTHTSPLIRTLGIQIYSFSGQEVARGWSLIPAQPK